VLFFFQGLRRVRRELTQSRQLVGAQHLFLLFLTDFSRLLLRLICYPLLLLLLQLLIRGRLSKSYYSLPRLHALSVFRLCARLQQQLLIILSSTLVLLLLILYQLAKRFVRMRIVL